MCDRVIVKNEPITSEEADFVDPFLEKTVVKCERIDSSYYNGSIAGSKTTICSESEYLAQGYAAFESVIVKEEPKLNYCSFDLPATSNVDYNNKKKVVRNWECYLCRHALQNAVNLRKHIKGHVITKAKRPRKTYPCDECDKKYSRRHSLEEHKLLHRGIKPYACDECDRKFAHSATQRRHKQTHSKVRPFVCELCDHRCARKSTLIRHLRTHTGEKLYTCELCNKKFSRNSTLNDHKLTHTAKNRFECNLCDCKYKMKSSLVNHLRTHSGVKAFNCDECDRKFFNRCNLTQHKKTHFLKLQLLQKYSDHSAVKPQPNSEEQNARVSDPKKIVTKIGRKTAKVGKKKSKFEILMNKCKSLRKI